MQRDIDLMRQLLFDIERRGATCALDSLCQDTRRDGDERLRYHVRLLVDAGLVKEAGQSTPGAPSVRLTHDGQEFIELVRSDARWREAKAAVLAATGGAPLRVLRSLLVKRAWRDVMRNERRRRARTDRRYHRYLECAEPGLTPEVFDLDADPLWDDDQVRLVREQTMARKQSRVPHDWELDLYGDVAAELADAPQIAALPEHLI